MSRDQQSGRADGERAGYGTGVLVAELASEVAGQQVHLTGAEQAILGVDPVDGHLVDDEQIRSARQAGVVGGGELQIDVDILDCTEIGAQLATRNAKDLPICEVTVEEWLPGS